MQYMSLEDVHVHVVHVRVHVLHVHVHVHVVHVRVHVVQNRCTCSTCLYMSGITGGERHVYLAFLEQKAGKKLQHGGQSIWLSKSMLQDLKD